MEATMTNQNWKIVSEIELIYKTKVKASERPNIENISGLKLSYSIPVLPVLSIS